MPLRIFGKPIHATPFFAAGAVGFTPHKAKRFKQGILSPGAYLNNRVLPSRPQEWGEILMWMTRRAANLSKSYDVIASVATGGTPHGVAIALDLHMPHYSVKAKEKGYGVGGLVDGDLALLKDKQVLLIEDMSSTFRSSLDAMEALVTAGARGVAHTLLLNTWGFPEFHMNIEGHSVHTMCTGEMFVAYALQDGRIDANYAALLQNWINRPYDESWSKEGWEIPPKKK